MRLFKSSRRVRLSRFSRGFWIAVGLVITAYVGVWMHLENGRILNESGQTRWLLSALFDGPSRAEKRLHRIHREIGELGPSHPWAGEYRDKAFMGGSSIVLAPKSGYVETNWGVDDSWTDDGTFTEKDGVFHFDFLSNQLSASLALVHWGKRLYLIPQDKLADFANDVNSGYTMRYWVRDRPIDAPDADLPELPGPEHRLLRLTPLDAEVLAASPPRPFKEEYSNYIRWRADVLLDVGEVEGAVPGLRFEARRGVPGGETKIIKTYAHYSVASYISENDKRVQPLKGWRFSTRFDSRRDWSFLAPDVVISTKTLTRPLPPLLANEPETILSTSSIAEARAAGISVRPVLRIEVRAIDKRTFDFFEIERIVDPLVRAGGANAYFLHPIKELAGLRPFMGIVEGLRFERHGQPLERFDFPSYHQGWARIDARMALDRNTFARSLDPIRTKAIERLLHMSAADYDRLADLRLEFLTQEQRDALRKYLGIDEEFGALGEDRAVGAKSSNVFWKAIDDAVKSQHAALMHSNPAGYAEFKRLQKLAHP